MPTRRTAIAAAAALAALPLVAAAPAPAHHGIVFTEDEQIRITGQVVKPMTGHPHFEFKVQVGDERWTVDVGDTFRLKKAGLSHDGSDMPVGRTVTVEGFPAADESLMLIQARTIWIGDEAHRRYDPDEPKY